MRQRECTAEEGERWRRDRGDGYSAGRGDGRWGRPPRIELVEVPPDLPGECGAQYVARHVGIAWQMGYAEGYRFAREHDLCTSYG